MKSKNNYTRQELLAYFKKYGYLMTFRQSINDAFYHWKTNKHLIVPHAQKEFSGVDIILIFDNSEATELGTRIEYARFKVFIDELRKKGTNEE